MRQAKNNLIWVNLLTKTLFSSSSSELWKLTSTSTSSGPVLDFLEGEGSSKLESSLKLSSSDSSFIIGLSFFSTKDSLFEKPIVVHDLFAFLTGLRAPFSLFEGEMSSVFFFGRLVLALLSSYFFFFRIFCFLSIFTRAVV